MPMRGNREDRHRYDDIIDHPHPTSKTHPRMALSDRAAQFSPFMALTGYESAIHETARRTEDWSEPDESSRAELDRRLAVLREHLRERPPVTVVFFQPDQKKAGGAYRSVSGVVKKIDSYRCELVLETGERLPFRYIVDMDGEIFVDISTDNG